ncbi:methyl-accepting chemotaxis protein [Endothiovibrio diazotrophicus]
MNALLNQMRVAHKLWLVVGIALVGLGALTTYNLFQYRQTLLEDRQLKTRHVVETAWSILGHFHDMESSGLVSREEAQRQAMELVKGLRYEGSEYFWINDMQPKVLMHPIKPQLDGQDASGIKDPNGKRLFVAFADEVKRNGAGFVDYLWPKPGSDRPVPKTSYVKGFQPWGWIIGSGIYIDDVDARFYAEALRSSGLFGLLLLLVIVFASFVVRSITRPLGELQRVMGEVADHGNLTVRARLDQHDEVGHMGSAFNGMLDHLNRFVGEVRQGIEQLSASAHQMAAVTEQTSRGVMTQRSQTDQAATAMNEMSATVQEVARNASEAADAARSADREANNGKRVVSTTIDAIDNLAGEVEKASQVIHKLEEDTDAIGTVLEVIRGIAEQTNLLALNAAIEAARAGEQGRGFAVVADEVRTLATRTQQSTEEIQQMITTLQGGARDAVSVMEEGRNQARASVEQAAKAGESLNAITEAVTRISDMNTQIASAAEEQSAVAEEVNRSVVSISQVADQTAAGAQQTSASSTELGRLAGTLHEMVERYKI